MAKLHIGKKIEEQIQLQQMKMTEFAKKISLTRNVAYDIIKRDSINTDLLLKICHVLNYNFFNFYVDQFENKPSKKTILASNSTKADIAAIEEKLQKLINLNRKKK